MHNTTLIILLSTITILSASGLSYSILKLLNLKKRKTVITLTNIIKPIDTPLPTLKGQNYRLKLALKEIEKDNKFISPFQELHNEFKLLNQSLVKASIERSKQYHAISNTLQAFNKQQKTHLNNLHTLKSLTNGGKND